MVKGEEQVSLKEQFKHKTTFRWWGVRVIAIFCVIMLFPSYASFADEVPNHIVTVIEKKAATQFPYNQDSKMRAIESQKSAYITVENYNNEKIPADILAEIKQRAALNCPTNYCAQKYLIETQAKDCDCLRNYSPEEVPPRILKRMLKNAQGEFPNDYSMQKMAVEAKVKEYLDFDRVTRLEYGEKVLDASLGEMEELLIALQKKIETTTQKVEKPKKAIRKKAKKKKVVPKKAAVKVAPKKIAPKKVVSQKAEPKKVVVQEVEPEKLAPEKVVVLKEEDLKAEPKKVEVLIAEPKKVEPKKPEILVKDQEAVEETVVEKQYHVIKKGENLYRISLRYGLSVDELCRINGITPKKTIRPGQKLIISE